MTELELAESTVYLLYLVCAKLINKKNFVLRGMKLVFGFCWGYPRRI